MKGYIALFMIISSILPVTGATMEISVDSVNTGSPGLYEKYELYLHLSDVSYSNPFDPDQVDIRATFTSPGGRSRTVNGFYDDYRSRDQWKVRFAPDEVGQWKCRLSVTDSSGTSRSAVHSFVADSSSHHGWIRASGINPGYLQHDDGHGFYGVGMCYPWNVTLSGLEDLAAHGANSFFYWNGTYDKAGNGGGTRLIESMKSGPGKYDQHKCARIDQLIEWAEQTGVKMILVIWPHDYLADDMPGGWVERWGRNPYHEITSAEAFYRSEEAWEYQKKLYRYIIARWGYSRGLAAWQIVAEISGTDGWVAGDTVAANQWTEKVHDYLKTHDPFGHPTTASQHGHVANDWPEGYRMVDLPNREIYENQGWPVDTLNPLRSSIQNYANIAGSLSAYSKPAIIGETGFTFTPVKPGTGEYTHLFHNALWAAFSNGLAATPYWWAYQYGRLVTDEILAQLRAFSRFVTPLTLHNVPWKKADVSGQGIDAYGLQSDNRILVWLRTTDGGDITGSEITLNTATAGAYRVSWIGTWSGRQISEQIIRSEGGALRITVPDLPEPHPDVALKTHIVRDR